MNYHCPLHEGDYSKTTPYEQGCIGEATRAYLAGHAAALEGLPDWCLEEALYTDPVGLTDCNPDKDEHAIYCPKSWRKGGGE